MWSWVKRTVYTLMWLAAFAAVLAGALSYGLARYQRRQAKQKPFVGTTTAQRGNFVVYTDNVGSLEAEEFTPVRAETSGQVIGLVPNGTVVKESDVIVALDVPRMLLAVEETQRSVQEAQDKIETTTHDRDADVRQAELALQRAQTSIEEARASTEANQKELEAQMKFDEESYARAEKELERTKRLAAAELIPGDQVRKAEVALVGQKFALEKQRENYELTITRATSEQITKEAAVRQATSGLERAKSRREDDLRSAKVNVETQQRKLKLAQDDLDKAFVRAPKAGLVSFAERGYGDGGRPLQQGDLVRTNEQIAQILDLSLIRAHLELPQRVGQLVKRDQRATVEVHGLPGQEFPGKVTQVSSFATASRERYGPPTGERSFRAYVRVAKFKPGLLKPGMRATVRIIIDELKNVVHVPLACVFTRGMGQRERKILWMRDGRDFREATVKLGQANEESVTISSGVKAGDEIALRDLQVQKAEPELAPPAGKSPESVVQQGGSSQ